MYAFLSALPAILGILGFVIFLILRSFGKGDTATLRIIDKLRTEHPDRFTSSKLTPKQAYHLLSEDQKLRKEVGQQDFVLLGQALRQQHIQSLTIYALCAGLFVVGVSLFSHQIDRTVPLKLSDIQLQDRTAQANGLLVDLDDLLITWHASGPPADVAVHAENLDTGAQTRSMRVRSSDGQIVLSRADYISLLSKRAFRESNRIRIVIQTSTEPFYSSESTLHVGLTILAVVFKSRVKIAAIIDNAVVDNYEFQARLVAPMRDRLDYLTIGGEISGAKDYPVQAVSAYDWDEAKLAYLGPDDGRLVRFQIIHE